MSSPGLPALCTKDLQSPSSLLFCLSSGKFFCFSVISALKNKIAQLSLVKAKYSGHSFQKGAAHHAADHGILDEMIQRLGRWTSNAFKLYFTMLPELLYKLNLSFQKGKPLAVLRVVERGFLGRRDQQRSNGRGVVLQRGAYQSLILHFLTLKHIFSNSYIFGHFFGKDAQRRPGYIFLGAWKRLLALPTEPLQPGSSFGCTLDSIVTCLKAWLTISVCVQFIENCNKIYSISAQFFLPDYFQCWTMHRVTFTSKLKVISNN